ncbi:hydroxymethylglutaryl-CoA synthase [candidate division KSB1 bacterium]|nr:hydroxymethylglutaryl-CoA synthase [candidate division KSB1 bacterium]RQW00632.1 MAG: hydroxymethylglutaryl-CoA synthase [candidate division KSB1 bacterium]
MQVGIESISFYTSQYYIDLKTLARQNGEDPNKYYIGIGQERMSVPPPDEDVVTLAANATSQALEGIDVNTLDTLLFATESGIDQSKAAGIYVHELVQLPRNMRVFELKQACYSGAGGLALALPYLLHHPDSRVLIVASDIARYGLGSIGEPTQGAGAVAFVLSTNPKIMTIDMESGLYTNDVMDFWRPNYTDEALVDGKYSIKMYSAALRESWQQYVNITGRSFTDLHRFVYHLPFTKMGDKAHQFLVRYAGADLSEAEWKKQIDDAAIYQRYIGNTYAGSVFLALASLLDNSAEDLTHKRVGLFSYGSGSVGEFFTGIIQPDYQKHLKVDLHKSIVTNRQELDYDTYKEFYSFKSNLPSDGSKAMTPRYETGRYRFAGLDEHKRLYEVVQ